MLKNINNLLKNKKFKIMAAVSAFTGFMVVLALVTYLWFFPWFVKTDFTLNMVKSAVNKALNLDFAIVNPKLKTALNSNIDFSVDNLTLKKENNVLFELDNFTTSFNFKNVFKKKIKLNYLSANKLLLKADELINCLPQGETQTEVKPIDWQLDLYNSKLNLKTFDVTYKLNKTLIGILASDIAISQVNNYKTLDFNSKINVAKNNKNYLNIVLNSDKDIRLMPNKLEVTDLDILLNQSKLKITSTLDDKELKLNAKSNKFYLEDVFKIIQSDLVIPDGEALLAPLMNPKGELSYDVNAILTLKDFSTALDGVIKVDGTKASIKDLAQLPLSVEKGKLLITKNKVDFQDLVGYYGKNKKNTFKIYGDIKDYYNSMDSNITIDTKVTNEFFKDYLSKLINNTVLYTSKPIGTRIIYNSKFNIMDITWLAKIDKHVNFGVDDTPSALANYDRAVKGDFHIEGNKLNIKNINYYIAPDIRKGVQIKPILTFDGDMDLMGNIERLGFFFAREMPSELLNVFVRQQMFKKGTLKGSLHIAFENKIPVLKANMELKDTFIPSQRMKIKTAQLKTNNDYIFINTTGRFKRANFDFKGRINNKLVAPVTIKNLSLDIDNLDIERVMASFNAQGENNGVQPVANTVSDDDSNVDDDFMFDTNLVRIEDGKFRLKKGKYKDLEFGNIDADITLNDKGILNIQSNKFDIAGGISTLKVICDLAKIKYYIRLGAKDVDSDLMARVLLNLDKEISGRASGLIELNSDKNMKLNGEIKFLVNNGTIGKIGLVEYVLKIASVFRNPVVMISPATIMDIVNIPEGKFDKITGEMKIKDNVVHSINIKSYSSQLAALIRGRFDMDKHDASLRIYTRFSTSKKSTFGFLRNLSLNALANKVQLNSRNDANYYSSELVDLPQIDVDEDKAQIFLTQVEGDVEHNNFISALKKIK